jgi:predicted GH43/DUF377 family glycosyl hydrolase
MIAGAPDNIQANLNPEKLKGSQVMEHQPAHHMENRFLIFRSASP